METPTTQRSPSLVPLSALEAEVLSQHFSSPDLTVIQHRVDPPAAIMELRERALALQAAGLPISSADEPQSIQVRMTTPAKAEQVQPRYQPRWWEEIFRQSLSLRMIVVINATLIVCAIFVVYSFGSLAMALTR